MRKQSKRKGKKPKWSRDRPYETYSKASLESKRVAALKRAHNAEKSEKDLQRELDKVNLEVEKLRAETALAKRDKLKAEKLATRERRLRLRIEKSHRKAVDEFDEIVQIERALNLKLDQRIQELEENLERKLDRDAIKVPEDEALDSTGAQEEINNVFNLGCAIKVIVS